jgi:hypothetical protein
LLDKWILNTIINNLHIEGFIKEFYLSSYCKKNLQLLSHVVYCSLADFDWEVQTPIKEKFYDENLPDLFVMPKQLKNKLQTGAQIFFRDLL